MLRQKNLKTLVNNARFAFSSSNGKEVQSVKYDPIEFEPFKFSHERERIYAGYSPEELYGTRYGLKHSEKIKNEMRKDSFMFVFALIAGISFAIGSRNRQWHDDEAYTQYVHRDMNTVRPILSSQADE